MGTALTASRAGIYWTDPAIPDRPARGFGGEMFGNGHMAAVHSHPVEPARSTEPTRSSLSLQPPAAASVADSSRGLPKPGRGGRILRSTPRSSMSPWMTRARITRSRSRVIVRAIQSI